MSNDASNEITLPSSIVELINEVQKDLELPYSLFNTQFMDQVMIAALLKGKSPDVKEKVIQDFEQFSEELSQAISSQS